MRGKLRITNLDECCVERLWLLYGWLVIVRWLVLHILDLLVMVLRVRMTAIWFSSP